MIATEGTLSALCAEAKKPAAREQIDRANEDRQALYALLGADRPKTRKNAARLLGALARERDAAALIAALAREDTLFVVPSILLALGSVGGEAAKAALGVYTPPEAADVSEQTHVEAIRDALSKAVASLFADALPQYRITTPRRFFAAAPAGFADMLLQELLAMGLSAEMAGGGCTVETADWAGLYRARCMSELLLPLGGDIPLEAQAIASAAAGELTLPYRIELSGYTGDRAKMLLEIKRAIGGENNPGHYALELRIVCRGERCALWLKPSFDEKNRYPWRKHSISASMKPALAACLARYIAPYVDKPRVLDPFCGSGTLLFSCEEAFPCASLLGVDISQNAVQAAKENAAAGKSRARFVQKDVRRFEPREPADLVIANLPFGNRVGTHGDNRTLYAAFLDRLPALLAPGGVALLYTMEYRLLSACLKRPGVPLLAETRRTEAGGLMPWVFILKK